MGIFLVLEASQPNGRAYRLGLGCLVHPQVASMAAVIVLLFGAGSATPKRGGLSLSTLLLPVLSQDVLFKS